MTKQDLKEQLVDYMNDLGEKLFKVIDAFPDESNWGWMEVFNALKYCTGYGYNQPVEKVIKNIKLSSRRMPPCEGGQM